MTEPRRRRLVRELERRGLIRSAPVREAFLAVPRELFLPDVRLERVYRDEAILTKQDPYGAPLSSSSQPAIMAAMLEALDVRPGQRVLEIGAGTGYNAALLSLLVGPEGSVTTVDIDPETAERADRALAEGRYPVDVVAGDGRAGARAGAPYDRIVVTASASEIPRAWFDQLAEGGLLQAPVWLRGGGAVQVIPTLRKEDGDLRSVGVLCGGFMPLRAEATAVPGQVAMLSAAEVRKGRRTQLLTLFGAGLGQMSAVARRRLLATALEQPRRRRLGVVRGLEALYLYLGLRIPERRLAGSSLGLGAFSADGRSLALLGWRGQLLAFGNDGAERMMLRLVERWKDDERPDETNLELAVRFTNGSSALRYRFRAA